MARKPREPEPPNVFWVSQRGVYHIEHEGIRVVIEGRGYESEDTDICFIPRAAVEAQWHKYDLGEG